jgi:DNA-binding MarR family transcriptional regulator
MRPNSLQAEIRQTRPFRTPRQAAVAGLLRTASVVSRFFERIVQAEGLSLAQYNALRILRGAGPEGLPTMAIRERLLDPAAGITRLLEKLERAGYVQRERSSLNRREVRCRATGQGLALLRRLDPAIDRADETALATLGPKQLRTLIVLLDRIRAQHQGQAQPR